MADGDIAIIGMSCRVAGANSPSELWDVLASSKDVQTKITRFNIDGFYHPEGGPRKGLTNVMHALMLDDNCIDKFDNGFFYTMPNEAVAMDPQQRMLLEIAYEAIESAGIPLGEFTGTDTAVFAGMEGSDYHNVLARDIDATPRYLATGTATCMAANRLSYFFNLSGPSMTVDTACSSTMAALHQAVRTLQHGDSGMALVCGAKLILTPDMFIPSSELGFLSPSGRCRSFDAAADGYGRGEGVLALLLKPLKLAVADKSPIRAVIKGSRLNQDGRTNGITLPSAEAQRRNMEELYKELNLCPSDIHYLEAHGTGTAVGDPLELSAISSVHSPYRQNCGPLVVGSIKSNIGHLESSSALASIVKVVQCLERSQIPSQMNFKHPNPRIDFSNILVPTEMLPWPAAEGSIRRAAVNTFGAGGTNGHAVLESCPRNQQQRSTSSVQRPFLLKVSAADEDSLRSLQLDYTNYAEKRTPRIQDLAYTLLSRRSTLRKSIYFTARTLEGAISELRSNAHQVHTKSSNGAGEVVLVFTGQGAQWAQMGICLVDDSPLFRGVLTECDKALAALPDSPSWSMIDELSKSEERSRLYLAEFSQPICTAIQLALVVLLRSWGLEPKAVVGHSSGEIAAAYTAGYLSLNDAIAIAYYRGFALSHTVNGFAQGATKGTMCAIGLCEKESRDLIERFKDRVQLAAVNSPDSCTLSGEVDAIEEVIAECAQQGHFCRKLRVDQAYHSRYMLPSASTYQRLLDSLNIEVQLPNSHCQMFSSVTRALTDSQSCKPNYWKQNMISTVQFQAALEQALHYCPTTSAIVEIGPHPALKGPVKAITQHLRKSNISYFSSCFRNKNDFVSLLENAALMSVHGIPLNLAAINRGIVDNVDEDHFLKDLPSYKWNHATSFWAESRVSQNVRFRQFRRHPLLGSRSLDDIPTNPTWRNHLVAKEIPWLMDLKAQDLADFPPIAYLLMALEAARQMQILSGSTASTLIVSNIEFLEPLRFEWMAETDLDLELQFIAKSDEVTGQFNFEILSAKPPETTKSWRRHCTGALGWLGPATSKSEVPSQGITHEISLLNNWKILGNRVPKNISELKVNHRGLTARFQQEPYQNMDFVIDPRLLHSATYLVPLPLIGQSLPARHNLSSIASVQVPIDGQPNGSGHFEIDVHTDNTYCIRSNLAIHIAKNMITIQDLRYTAEEILIQNPASSSLFFRAVVEPDITTLRTSNVPEGAVLTLFRLAQLLGHKSPMSDIGIRGLQDEAIENIFSAFGAHDQEARPLFRTIDIIGGSMKRNHFNIRSVQKFDKKYHLMFTDSICDPQDIWDHLHPTGFWLLRSSSHGKDKNDKLLKLFARISQVSGPCEGSWELWRRTSERAPVAQNLILFSSGHSNKAELLGHIEHVQLNHETISRFCRRESKSRFSAIIIDDADVSVITKWPGRIILPWLQRLMEFADAILWVTKARVESPFQQVAGTLLRTLQSELPSLKVRWLVVREETDEESLWRTIEDAYFTLQDDNNEIKSMLTATCDKIVRYYPDDALSTTVGLIPPRKTKSALTGKRHKLTFAAPQLPLILSYECSGQKDSSENDLQVLVEASVIGPKDSRAFESIGSQSHEHCGFFAGRTLGDRNDTSKGGNRVVGYIAGSHMNITSIPPNQLFEILDELVPTEAASEFAAVAVASCIVDGETRARESDIFDVRIEGVLQVALHHLIQQAGASMLTSGKGLKVDFTVTLNEAQGVQVNGKEIGILSYLSSVRGREFVERAWGSGRLPLCHLKAVDLSTYGEAFAISSTYTQPYSTAVNRNVTERTVEHVPIYEQNFSLLSSSGQYILIGGLGGLGRFICAWMVEHGARHLAVVSRSGLSTLESVETQAYITSCGASLQVYKADACDRERMHEILLQIRQGGPIKGVINLAMVLGDAPMASMTGEEWDRALRVKLDSSWILHEETLDDSLEFFILFSSIASVCGNRNQGNYNVANTFLNALAEYRQSINKPGIAIALGAMTDIGTLADMGVLFNLAKPNMLSILTRSGLSHLTRTHLAKIMEAAILESRRRDRSLIVTGLEMFSRDADGKLKGRTEPLYWAELPEFSHLQTYDPPPISDPDVIKPAASIPLKDQLKLLTHDAGDCAPAIKILLTEAFLDYLATLIGFSKTAIDPSYSLAMYGLDSLSGVGCQYWFWREVGVDVTVGRILTAASITALIDEVGDSIVGEGK